MCYGGQGDSNALGFDEFHELVQITEAVKNFIVEEVLGYNKHANSVMEEQEEECLIAVLNERILKIKVLSKEE